MAKRAKEALRSRQRQTESPFWTAFLISPEVILIHEPDGTILEANPAAQEKLGYSIEELEGMNILDLVLVSKDLMRDRVQEAGARGELSFRALHRRKDGTTFESEVRTRIVEVEGREIVVGIGRDITDLRLAEMLNSSLDRMSSSLGSRMGFDELMRSTVRAAREALGSDSAIVALRDGDEWSLSFEDGFTRFVRTEVFTSEQSVAAATVARTGRLLLVNDVPRDARMNQDFAARFGIRSLLMAPLKTRGETIGLLGFFCHDREGAFSDAHVDFANKLAYSVSLLLENARLTEAERATEAFLSGVVDTVPDAIMVLDRDGHFTFVNKEAERVLNLSREEILKRGHADARWEILSMNGEPVKPGESPFTVVLRSKEAVREAELRFAGPQGEDRFFSINMSPLYAQDGAFDGAIASLTDITDRKRSEVALMRRTHQLEVLTEVSNKLNSELRTDTIMRSLVGAALELTEATSGASGTYADGRMEFTEYNQRGRLIPINFAFPKGYGVPGWIISTKKAYMTNDAAHDVHVVPEVRQTLGFTNLVDVPILDPRGNLLGCFEVHNKAGGRDFTADDMAILEGLASSAAVALENARTLEEKAQYEAALQKQKRDYQTVFESAPALIAVKDTQNRVVIANRTFLNTFGLTPENADRWVISQDPGARERHYRDDQEVIRSRAPVLGVVEAARSGDGERIWLRTDKVPYLDAAGNVVGVIMFSLDITEQRRAQEQLEKEKEQMATLMETTPSGIVLVDRRGRVVFANRSAEGILGLGRSNMAGRRYDSPDWAITTYEGEPFPVEQLPFSQVMATGRPVYGVRHAIQAPDGKRVMLLMNAAPIHDDRGEMSGVIVSMEDVTGTILTERALRVSMKTSDDIIQQIPSGILLFQYRPPDGLTLLSVNPTANALLGGLENKLGEDFDQIWKEGAFFATKEEFMEVAKTGRTLWREGVHYSDITVDGVFTFRAFYLPGDKLCVNFDDVTERTREAQLRREAFDRIEKNIEHFATLVDRIRNPLSAILAQAEGCEQVRDRIVDRASEIEIILSQLDQGWLESEKVRGFLKKSL